MVTYDVARPLYAVADTLRNFAKVYTANAFNKITPYHRKTNELLRSSLQIRLKRCLSLSVAITAGRSFYD